MSYFSRFKDRRWFVTYYCYECVLCFLSGIIGGVAVALMCAVLLLLFIVYRLRKKDEGSYALDEPKNSPAVAYTKANDREFFA